MGLRYDAAESAALRTALAANVGAATRVLESTEAACVQLTDALGSGELSGQGYAAVEALFTEIIRPCVVKAQAAVLAVQSDLDVYSRADAHVSGFGVLFEDELVVQCEATRDQRDATLQLIDTNRAAAATMPVLAPSLEASNTKLEVVATQLEADLLEVEGRVTQLRDFAATTAGLFGDRLAELEATMRDTVTLLDTLDARSLTTALTRVRAGKAGKFLMDADERLLDVVLGMSPSELADWAEQHPELVDRILATADPEVVAAWWAGLNPGGDPGTLNIVQMALLTAAPTLFGNLGGVSFTGRDAANRIALTDWVDAHPDDPAALALTAALAASQAPPRQLITFLPAQPPMAAISIGNLDTATHVSYAIPGMGTTVAGSAQSWALDAWRLWDQLDQRNQGSGSAVVAWMNYEAPPMITEGDPAVLGAEHAYAGAVRLEADLAGFLAVRGDDPFLGVIGHSYGTTTAFPALTRIGVDAFVMLGSAGITNDYLYEPLLVPEGNVWASMGNEPVAIGGQIGSILIHSQPGGDPGQVRYDPSTSDQVESFHSSSDTYGPDGQILHGVNVHETAMHDTDPSKHGYLDEGTASLLYSGYILAGQADHVPTNPDRVPSPYVGGRRWAP